MAAKRSATTTLDQDNWNNEEDAEEVGFFKQASSSEMNRRKLKKGKRTLAEASENKETPSVFTNFSAFASSNANSTPSFSFSSSGKKDKEGESKSTTFLFGSKNKESTTGISSLFSFGNKEKDSTSTGTGFSFENKDKASNNSPITFGNNDKETSKSTFSFGNQDKETNKSTFSFGNQDKKDLNKSEDLQPSSMFQFSPSSNEAKPKGVGSPKSVESTVSSKSPFMFGGGSKPYDKEKILFSPLSSEKEAPVSIFGGKKSTSSNGNVNDDFLYSLKHLNSSVLEFLKESLEKNQYVNLSPIFDDYKMHFKKLKDDNSSNKENKESKVIEKTKTSSESIGGSSFSSLSSSTGTNTSASKPATFSFGLNDKTKDTAFGAAKSTGFSFGVSTSATPFSFGMKAAEASTISTEKEEEEDEPEEIVEVKEDDAIYEKKVKLFYKKDNTYVDKGVGTLFLKPAGEKVQLIVRALTNLGNILLNIILNESLPTQRMGKNNVLLVCVPNPPVDSSKPTSPVSMLIRVKTSDDADELLSKIDENKK